MMVMTMKGNGSAVRLGCICIIHMQYSTAIHIHYYILVYMKYIGLLDFGLKM